MGPGPTSLLTAALWLTVPLAGPPAPEPADPCAARRLTCISLVPTDAYRSAAGHALVERAPGPFGAAVTADGTARVVLDLSLSGLPPPGDGAVYVAWAATPVLHPVIRLGEVTNGRLRLGPFALDRYLVLITAETSGGVDAPSGTLVLRGTSPALALQPHELPALLAAAAGGLREPAAAGAHATAHGPDSAGWTPPPMHPSVGMLPGLDHLRPDVAPWLPPAAAATLPPARPTRLLTLADGDSLELVAAPVRRSLGGRTLTQYGFNGQIPGPLLQVPRGATITVRFTNRTAWPATIHWHGVRLDNASDGVPHVTQPPVPPGGTFTTPVKFPDAGIYWYHPHHREDVTQDLGLSGNIRVVEPAGAPEPVHREEVLLLDDLLVDAHGLVPYGEEAPTHALMGRFGTLLLVNGEPAYAMRVRRGEVVRFFLTNAAATRTFNLGFGRAPLKVVATDLGRFEREAWAESVVLAPAERYVVDVRFDEPGRVPLVNRVISIDHLAGVFFPEVDTLGWIEVGEEAVAEDLGEAFDRLAAHPDVTAEVEPLRRLADRPPDRTLELDVRVTDLPFPLGALLGLERAWFPPIEWSGTMPEMNWVATGRRVEWILRDPETGRENEAIEWRFRQGDVFTLRIENRGDGFHAMQHPIHLHGQRFLVLAQDGTPNENLAWKDTALVPAGSAVDLAVEISNPGRWMLHCHIAEHLAAGMRTILTVDPDPDRPAP